MEKIIKWGIIGAGRIARKFASDLMQVPNCELTAVSSTSLTRAQEFIGEFNAKHAFGSYEELFSVDIDVVYVATPHTFHKEHTLLCIKNNVGVLCEKPFAMDLEEVQLMIEAAKAQNIFLMEAMWTRFLPSTLKTLELLNQNKIGKIKCIHADFGFKANYDEVGRAFNPSLGGGALLDIGIYPAFLSLLLLGYPSEILATATFAETGVDETTSFIYKYENEATAVLNCTFVANTNCDAVIYGELGDIVIHRRFHESKKVSLNLNSGEKEVFDFPRETFGYNFEILEANDCIRKNQIESSKWSLADSVSLIKLLDTTRLKANIQYLS